jgi:hypothetical protein
VPILSSSDAVSEFLSGKRRISKSQAKRLAGFFHVPVEVFIRWPSPCGIVSGTCPKTPEASPVRPSCLAGSY